MSSEDFAEILKSKYIRCLYFRISASDDYAEIKDLGLLDEDEF